jgi:hypothetical protein
MTLLKLLILAIAFSSSQLLKLSILLSDQFLFFANSLHPHYAISLGQSFGPHQLISPSATKALFFPR